MPDFYVPRNLLKYLEADQADASHTHDITVGDAILFHHHQQAERSRLTALRARVSEVLAGQGDRTALLAEVHTLERGVQQGLTAMQAHHGADEAEQTVLEQSIEAYQWVLEGLAQIRQEDHISLVEGLGLVERAISRIDELLKPAPDVPPPEPLTDIKM